MRTKIPGSSGTKRLSRNTSKIPRRRFRAPKWCFRGLRTRRKPMICGASSSSSDRTARRNEQFSSRFNLIIESAVDRIEVDDHCRCSKIRTDSTNRASEWAAFRQKLSEPLTALEPYYDPLPQWPGETCRLLTDRLCYLDFQFRLASSPNPQESAQYSVGYGGSGSTSPVPLQTSQKRSASSAAFFTVTYWTIFDEFFASAMTCKACHQDSSDG